MAIYAKNVLKLKSAFYWQSWNWNIKNCSICDIVNFSSATLRAFLNVKHTIYLIYCGEVGHIFTEKLWGVGTSNLAGTEALPSRWTKIHYRCHGNRPSCLIHNFYEICRLMNTKLHRKVRDGQGNGDRLLVSMATIWIKGLCQKLDISDHAIKKISVLMDLACPF